MERHNTSDTANAPHNMHHCQWRYNLNKLIFCVNIHHGRKKACVYVCAAAAAATARPFSCCCSDTHPACHRPRQLADFSNQTLLWHLKECVCAMNMRLADPFFTHLVSLRHIWCWTMRRTVLLPNRLLLNKYLIVLDDGNSCVYIYLRCPSQ